MWIYQLRPLLSLAMFTPGVVGTNKSWIIRDSVARLGYTESTLAYVLPIQKCLYSVPFASDSDVGSDRANLGLSAPGSASDSPIASEGIG